MTVEYASSFVVAPDTTIATLESLVDKFREVGSAYLVDLRRIDFRVEAADLWDLREALAELKVEVDAFGLGDLEIGRDGVQPDRRAKHSMMTDLHPGAMYRVRFRQQGGNYRWTEREMVAQFVEARGHVWWFSLRPAAGTTEVHAHDVVSIEAAPDAPASRPVRA